MGSIKEESLIPGLFKKEFSKIAAVLTRSFGIEHLGAAEDIASDTFIAALETWTYKGVPQNPTAWLYAVAKNKARNYLQREQTFNGKVTEDILHTSATIDEIEADWSTQHIADSQLQMLFAICHPVIPVEAQIGLSLRILCGFGIEEIANAFLTTKDVINKRLYRAKEKLRESKVVFEMPSPTEINERLNTVLTTLYLLFNEGYYSESREVIIREDLCLEAMTLTHLLLQDERTNLPPVHALLALMCLHASRFPARKNVNASLVLYEDQDESLWNKELISRGVYHLHQAATGNQLTRYHLEASIAYWHTIKEDTPEKWENILQLYNKLLRIEYSPIAALNRTYALAKANGKHEAIWEAEKLQLTTNQYYFTLLGELYGDVDNIKSIDCYNKALALASTQADKNAITQRLSRLGV